MAKQLHGKPKAVQGTAVLVSGLLALSALVACAPTSGALSGRMARLADRVVAAPAAKGMVTMRIEQPAAYGLKFVSLAEWERAQVTLTRAAPAFTSTDTVNAFVNTNGSRQATINFTNVPTGTGFSLTVNLQRRDAAGTYQTLATGTNTGVTIAAGANNSNVTVAAVPGQATLNVTVNDPTQTFTGVAPSTGTVSSSVTTNTFYTLDRAVADPAIGSIAGLAQKGAGFLVGSPVDNRIFDTNNGFAAIDDGALPYPNKAWGLVRMADGSYLVAEDDGTANSGRIRVLTETTPNVWDYSTVVAGGGAVVADSHASGTSAQLTHARYIVADEDGTAFFAEVGAGKIWRINPTTSTMQVVANSLGNFAITGLAWDRVNDRLYVAYGTDGSFGVPTAVGAATHGFLLCYTTNVKTTGAPLGAPDGFLDSFADLGLNAGDVPMSLTYDPTGNLYMGVGANNGVYTTTPPAAVGASRIIKFPLNTAGTALGASGPVVVAGTGGNLNTLTHLVGVGGGPAGGAAARTYTLGSLYGGGLVMETQNTNGVTLGGHIVFPSNNDNQVQLLRLTPPTF